MTALLVIEVADSSLEYDRRRKAQVYSRAGEYWITNLVDMRLEVHRQPSPTGYLTQFLLGRDGVVVPEAAPAAAISVEDLLL